MFTSFGISRHSSELRNPLRKTVNAVLQPNIFDESFESAQEFCCTGYTVVPPLPEPRSSDEHPRVPYYLINRKWEAKNDRDSQKNV